MADNEERALSRRDLLRAGVGLGAGVAAAGPLASLLDGVPAGAATVPRSKPSGTLNVWIHAEPPSQLALGQIFKAYMKKNPKVNIKVLAIPYAQFEAKVLTAFVGGNPPDLVKIGGWDFASYASKGLFAPVDPAAMGYRSEAAFKSAFAPGSLASLKWGSKFYGTPIDYENLILLYRRDHFREVGLNPDRPPTTWPELQAAAQKLTIHKSNGQLKRAGLQPLFGVPIWDLLQFNSVLAGLGGSILSNNQKAGNLSSSKGVAAMTYYADLFAKHKVGSPQFQNLTLFPWGQMAKGDVSMTITGLFAVPLTASKTLKFGDQLDVAKIQQWNNGKKEVAAYTWGWAVSQHSSNKDTAFNLLRYINERSNADLLMGTVYTVVPVTNWQAWWRQPPQSAGNKGALITADQIKYSAYGPVIPQWANMAQQLSNNIVAACNGQKTPAQACADFDGAMQSILAGP
jgi:ABC-type glycerol-3-phosphate transport system substrate-binding protein